MKSYPLTESQLGMYLAWSNDHASTQYAVPVAFRLPRTIDLDRLEKAVRTFVDASPVYRTRFVEEDGEVRQVSDPSVEVPILRRKVSVAEAESALDAYPHPYDYFKGPLFRVEILETPEGAWIIFDWAHVIVDGTAGTALFAAVSALYDGADAAEAIKPEEISFFAYAESERKGFESADYREAAEDAKTRFGGRTMTVPEEQVKVRGGGGQRNGSYLDESAWVGRAGIDAWCRANGVHPNLFFMGVFARTLGLYANEKDVVFWTVNHGRKDPALKTTRGLMVKTVPVLGELKGELPLADYFKSFKLHKAGVYPFTHFCRDLGVKPGWGFVYQEGTTDYRMTLGTSAVEGALLAGGGAGEMPVLQVFGGAEKFQLQMTALPGRYSAAFLKEFAERCAVVAENFVKGDSPLLRGIPVLTDEEQNEVLGISKGEDLEYDRSKTFVDLFAAQAKARPEATAVVDCEGSITYGELDARSDALAAKLAALGVKPGGFVGLMLPRTRAFPVAMIAVQKCGAGYVPMDPEYPADRLAYMLENSEAPVLVTVRGLFADKNLDFKGQVVFFEEEGEMVRRCEGEMEPSHPLTLSPSHPLTLSPSHPAYMIYTSGSTGRPKGVVIPHRALRHMVAWTVEAFELRPGSRVATHPSFSFDASVIDLFPVLCAGGELHIYGEEIRKDLPGMRDYIVKNGIEGGTMSTQIGMTLLDTYPDLPLRYMILGGEKLMPIAKTNVKIINGYGPTEFTVISSYQVVDQSKEGDIPIGRAAPGTMSLIVDRYGHLLPQGFAGELALAGPQIADGYWKLPEKTQSVFVECPLSTLSPSHPRMYRTGDLARYNDEGTIDYMGRLDFQVKLRGFRIEIGEIEHAAASFPGVGAVAAEVRDVAGAQHLVLYYSTNAQTLQPSNLQTFESGLRDFMSRSLTSYMVPDYFVRMDPLPLTPNGKINRKLLPSPEGTSAEAEYVEPANETERKIAAAYGEILKLGKFGATTDFFASGGTSLIGIKAVVALQKAGLDVQYGDLFKYKTPRALACFLDPSLKNPTDSTVHLSPPPPPSFDYGAYDYTAIDRLLMATPTELFEGFRRHSLGDVLLTGATGYLGIHVLRYLLESTDATVYALVRPKRGVSPEKRLDSQYVYYFGERVPRRFKERLSFVEGDITDKDLDATLSPSHPLTIGTVLNCAALVKHYVADDLMDRINVGGVENLVAWCEKSGARLIHVSTYSVGGMIRTDSAAVLDERHLYIGQESDNDYVRTKFLAERAVLAAVAAGRLKGKIMRLGNLMGREADGEFQMNVGANAFVNSLKSYKALGAYPLENLSSKIEMSPIDRVAEAVCLLSTTPDSMCVFHPYNCYPLDMGAVMGAMNRHGFNVDWVSRAEFAAHVDALRNDPSRAQELQGVLHYTGHLLKGLRITPAPNDWTTTVLYRLGFRWKPAEDGYLARFLEMLDGLAVFG